MILFDVFLLPALVATLSGLLAHARGRPGWAVGLGIVGFIVVMVIGFAATLLGLVLQSGVVVVAITWSGVALYWLIAFVISSSLDKRPAVKEHHV